MAWESALESKNAGFRFAASQVVYVVCLAGRKPSQDAYMASLFGPKGWSRRQGSNQSTNQSTFTRAKTSAQVEIANNALSNVAALPQELRSHGTTNNKQPPTTTTWLCFPGLREACLRCASMSDSCSAVCMDSAHQSSFDTWQTSDRMSF